MKNDRKKISFGVNMLRAMGLEIDTNLENDMRNKFDDEHNVREVYLPELEEKK